MIVVTLGAIAWQSIPSVLGISALIGMAVLLLGALLLLLSRAMESAGRDVAARGRRHILQPAMVRMLSRNRRLHSSCDGHPAAVPSRAPPTSGRPPRSSDRARE